MPFVNVGFNSAYPIDPGCDLLLFCLRSLHHLVHLAIDCVLGKADITQRDSCVQMWRMLLYKMLRIPQTDPSC